MADVVFLGPSLPRAQAEKLHPQAVFLPPVAQGDVLWALREYQPTAVGIIDGVFRQSLSVWHKEILAVLADGVRVYGAASMGALRAAECADFGMIGVGEIFRQYHTGLLTRDDEVAVAYSQEDGEYQLRSEPMVNLRSQLQGAVEAQILPAVAAAQLTELAQSWYFPERTWPRLLAAACLPPEQQQALAEFVRNCDIDVKAADARRLLERMWQDSQMSPGTIAAGIAADWNFVPTHYFAALVEQDRCLQRQGVKISPNAIARHIWANDPHAPKVEHNALTRQALYLAAVQLGIAATAAERELAWRGFAGNVAGLKATVRNWDVYHPDVQQWCRRHDWVTEDLQQFLEQEALIIAYLQWVRMKQFKRGTTAMLLTEYRQLGTYEQWADNTALSGQINGVTADGHPAEVPLPELPRATQLQQHARATGWRIPTDLTQWCTQTGFITAAELFQEVERSRRVRVVKAAGRSVDISWNDGVSAHE